MPSVRPTYEELTKRDDVIFISEFGGYRYVKLKPTEKYENCIWRVDKETKAVSRMNFVDYLCDIDRLATYVYAIPEWKELPA